MFRIIIVFLVAVASVDLACAQEQKRSRRITKAFTEPVEQSIAASPEIGIIVESNVKEGDRVRVGDTLAKINQRVLVKSLAIATAKAKSTARLDAATSRLELIKSQLKAIQDLVAGGHTNKFEVEQTEAEYQNAFADFRMAQDEHRLDQLEVERIGAQVEDRIIRSPIDGFVTEIHKRLGENVSSNDPKYATIVQVDQLKVRFYLEDSILNKAQSGSQATILLGPSKLPTTATITYVSPITDPDSGLGRLDIQIENQDYKIRSGTVCYFQSVQGESVQEGNSVQGSVLSVQNRDEIKTTLPTQHKRIGQLPLEKR